MTTEAFPVDGSAASWDGVALRDLAVFPSPWEAVRAWLVSMVDEDERRVWRQASHAGRVALVDAYVADESLDAGVSEGFEAAVVLDDVRRPSVWGDAVVWAAGQVAHLAGESVDVVAVADGVDQVVTVTPGAGAVVEVTAVRVLDGWQAASLSVTP